MKVIWGSNLQLFAFLGFSCHVLCPTDDNWDDSDPFICRPKSTGHWPLPHTGAGVLEDLF